MTYLPTISTLLTADTLPEELGFMREALAPLLNRTFYKDLYVGQTPKGDAGEYALTLVWYGQLGISVPGIDGLTLAAFPGEQGSTEIPLSLAYQWEILRYIPAFERMTPAGAYEWFSLLLEAFNVDPTILLMQIINVLVEEGDGTPLERFIASSGRGLLVLADDPAADQIAHLIQQMDALGLDLTQIVYEDYIEVAADKLERITALFSAWLGNIEPPDLWALIVPQVNCSIDNLKMGLFFPRGWLKPLDEQGNVIADAAAQSALTFDVGRLRFTNRQGLELIGESHFDFTPSEILETGFTLAMTNAQVDISQTDNIPAAIADGRPDDFLGVYAEEVKLGLPRDWFDKADQSTAELYGSDVLIGSGGISGSFGLRAVAPGVADPVLHFNLGAPNGLAIGLRHFEMQIKQNELRLARLAGSLLIPGLFDENGEPARLDMEARLSATGSLHIETRGQIYLGNDIWLYPQTADKPILTVDLAAGPHTSFAFQVDALFKLPQSENSATTTDVFVSGHLQVALNGAGELVLQSFLAESSAANLGWQLLGNATIDQLLVSLAYSQSEQRFSVTLGGSLLLPDIDLSFQQITGRLNILSSGFDIMLINGSVTLPPTFGPDPDDATSIPAIAINPSEPIQLLYRPGLLRFEGQLLFINFGLSSSAMGIGDTFVVKLETATLTLPSLTIDSGSLVVTPPTFEKVNGYIRLPVGNDQTAELVFRDVAWGWDGLPTGTLALEETVFIPLSSADPGKTPFAFAIVGGYQSAAGQDPWTGIIVSKTPTTSKVTINGKLLVTCPADALTNTDGDQIALSGAGALTYLVGDPLPTFAINELAIDDVTLHLGGKDGIAIHNGAVRASQFGHMLNPTPAAPFLLDLSGGLSIQDSGPRLDVSGLQFIFEGDPVPALKIPESLSLEPGEEMLALAEEMPVRVTKGTLQVADNDLPVPEILHPSNLSLLISGELEIPIPPEASFIGIVDEIGVSFSDLGLPIVHPPAGIGMGIEDIKVATLMLTGSVYLGGLNDPRGLFFAGKVGGSLNGAGITALAAFGLNGPRGVCLEVNLGQSGVPLGQTGILLTGVTGGVSFMNSNSDPCDFRTYVQLGDDGRPVDNPTGTAEPIASGPDREPQVQTALIDSDSGPVPCPSGECPPPSLNILCEPHPETNEAIIKFSSFDQPFVDQLLTQLSLDPAALETLDSFTIAAQISGAVRSQIEALWLPLIPAQLDQIQEDVKRKLTVLENSLFTTIKQAVDGALGTGQSVYDAILAVAYAGVPCLDSTIKLTGTFSYVGVSTFLSVTGGFILSSSGAAGIIGSLNLIGIPIGTLEGFFIATDINGDPNPALCGDIEMALGPLELGHLRFAYECAGCMTGVLEAVAQFGQHLSAPFIDRLLQVATPALVKDVAYDPQAPLALMLEPAYQAEALAFVGKLISLPPAVVGELAAEFQITPQQLAAQITACLVDLYTHAWQSFNPQISMCGQVQPKLFGLPLSEKVVEVRSHVVKGEKVILAAKFAFSPAYLLSTIFYLPVPIIDQASVGYQLELPDPGQLIQDGITGQFHSAEALAAYLKDGFLHALGNATASITYEIAPFGLKLVSAHGRFLMPHLSDHPAHPQSKWEPPHAKDNRYPTRLALTQKMLSQGHLGVPQWRGTREDLNALTEGDTRNRLSLREDFFPHGGFLGAGLLDLPRALTRAPDLAAFQTIVSGQDLVEQFKALAGYIGDYILKTDRVGDLTFYLPAPNPPIFTLDGHDLNPYEMMQAQMAQSDNPFSLDQFQASPLYSHEYAFMRGHIDGQLLGIPIAEMILAAQPPQADGEWGYMLASATIPGKSWLELFVEEAHLTIEMRQPPLEPIEQIFKRQLAKYRNPRNRTPSLFDEILADVQKGMPKLSIVGSIEHLKMPPGLDLLLGVSGHVSAELHAYSPLFAFDKDFDTFDDPVALAQNYGGVVLRCLGDLTLGYQFGLTATINQAEFALHQAALDQFPSLSATLVVEEVTLPFGLPFFSGVVAQLNTGARGAKPLVRSGGLTLSGSIGGKAASLQLKQSRNSPYLQGNVDLNIDLDLKLEPLNHPVTGARLADQIHLDTSLTGLAALTLSPNKQSVTFKDGRFTWNDNAWQLPNVSSSNPDSSLITLLIEYIIEHRNAVLAGKFSPEEWISAVLSGAISLRDQSAAAIAAGLKALGATILEAARLLDQFFDNTLDILSGLYAHYNSNLVELLDTLWKIGKRNSEDLTAAVFAKFKQQQAAASTLAQWLYAKRTDWSNPINTIADRFESVKYTLNTTAKALLSISGATLGDIVKGLYNQFGNNLTNVLNALWAAGKKNSNDLTQAVYHAFGQQQAAASTFAQWLYAKKRTDWSNRINSIAKRFKSAQYALNTTAKALLSISGAALGDIVKGLYNQFGKDLAKVLDALWTAGKKNSNDLTQTVYHAFGQQQAAASTFAQWLYAKKRTDWSNRINSIAKRFAKATYEIGVTANALASISGATITKVTSALNNNFNVTFIALANALKEAFTVGEIIAEFISRGWHLPPNWGN